MSSDQSGIIEQDRFTYLPLIKTFEKQIKTIEDKSKKQVEALEVDNWRRDSRKYINWRS